MPHPRFTMYTYGAPLEDRFYVNTCYTPEPPAIWHLRDGKTQARHALHLTRVFDDGYALYCARTPDNPRVQLGNLCDSVEVKGQQVNVVELSPQYMASPKNVSPQPYPDPNNLFAPNLPGFLERLRDQHALACQKAGLSLVTYSSGECKNQMTYTLSGIGLDPVQVADYLLHSRLLLVQVAYRLALDVTFKDTVLGEHGWCGNHTPVAAAVDGPVQPPTGELPSLTEPVDSARGSLRSAHPATKQRPAVEILSNTKVGNIVIDRRIPGDANPYRTLMQSIQIARLCQQGD